MVDVHSGARGRRGGQDGAEAADFKSHSLNCMLWLCDVFGVCIDRSCPVIGLLTFRRHMARWRRNNTVNPPRRRGLAVSLDIMDSDGFTHETRDVHIRIWVVLMRFNPRSDSCSSCSYDPRRDLHGSSLFHECLRFIYYEVSLQDGRGKHPLCSWN